MRVCIACSAGVFNLAFAPQVSAGFYEDCDLCDQSNTGLSFLVLSIVLLTLVCTTQCDCALLHKAVRNALGLARHAVCSALALVLL
jgi:hypothetical protein